MTAPRVRPGRRAEVGLFTHLFAKGAGRVAGTEPLKLFLTLGRRRRMFHAWLLFAGTLMPGGKLSRRESELVILRVAHLRDCRYELEHHSRLGRRAGIGTKELDRLAAGPDAEGWTPRERALLAAVDVLHTDKDLDDATWAKLRVHLTEPECVELCMLAEHYQMLATVITALRIQPDRPRR
ncbi:carboxymuconolactone decarboxylase family protein [Spirillospora sp. NPDC029432]|uniref:carboxymuconolactone decarboxylase family protein n=1 Tax=Spirillospora sp. NPDC029432 TaxID=3154599 RepID=UPI003452EA50